MSERKYNPGGLRTSVIDVLYSMTDDVEEITAYHLLAFGFLDIYPETKQYYNRDTKKRGIFHSYGFMRRYIREVAEKKGIGIKQPS